MLPILEMNGNCAVQRLQCGEVKAKLGQKTKAYLQVTLEKSNVCNEALHVIGLYGSGDKISLFLKDWELARVALSCHVALVMPCQEMHDAWQLGDATKRPAVTA